MPALTPAPVVLPLIEAGRATEAEADQAATAEIAVAADLDSLDDAVFGVVKGSVDVERRGESYDADRLSQVERRALEWREGGRERGR